MGRVVGSDLARWHHPGYRHPSECHCFVEMVSLNAIEMLIKSRHFVVWQVGKRIGMVGWWLDGLSTWCCYSNDDFAMLVVAVSDCTTSRFSLTCNLVVWCNRAESILTGLNLFGVSLGLVVNLPEVFALDLAVILVFAWSRVAAVAFGLVDLVVGIPPYFKVGGDVATGFFIDVDRALLEGFDCFL